MARTMIMVMAAVLSLGLDAGAQGKAGESEIAWAKTLKEAKAEAAKLNKPLWVAFTMRDEPANDEIRRKHFHDKKIVESSRRFVCVDAYQGTAIGDAARLEFLSTSLVSAPQFLFLTPKTHNLLLRHVWMLSSSQLLEKMNRAYAFFDPKSAGSSAKLYEDRVSLLMKEAEGPNQEKRRAALKTLSDLDDPRIMKLLIRLTKAGRQNRLEAIFFMGRRGNAKALPYLHRLVQSRDTQTAVYAAIALESIAMVESGPFIKKALAKARMERLRVNLLRALAATAPDDPELPKILIKAISRRSNLEKIVALWIVAHREKDPKLVKPVIKSIANRDDHVRCAAYVAVGNVPLSEAGKTLLKKLKYEKGKPKDCCQWALEQLGLGQYDGETDPETLVDGLLPDSGLRDGDIDDTDNKRRRGGRSGGRGGRGGGRR